MRILSVSAMLLALSACGGTLPPQAHSVPATPARFETASLVSIETLNASRGGFVTVGGISFDFGINTTSFINGTVQNSLSLSTDGLSGQIPANLRQLVQVGGGNQTALSSPAALSNNVLTVIQNSQNNQVIQSFNTLNVTAHLNQFGTQTAALASQGALVNALH